MDWGELGTILGVVGMIVGGLWGIFQIKAALDKNIADNRANLKDLIANQGDRIDERFDALNRRLGETEAALKLLQQETRHISQTLDLQVANLEKAMGENHANLQGRLDRHRNSINKLHHSTSQLQGWAQSHGYSKRAKKSEGDESGFFHQM